MNGAANPGRAARGRVRLPGGVAPWVLALICLGLAAGGESVRELARFERAGLEAGQLWRLVTAHLVHLGWAHTLLNVAALGLVAALFGDVMRRSDWGLGLLSAAIAIDAGLYGLAPGVDWYVGLSGVLHGLVLVGAVRLVAAEPVLGLVVLGALAVKLAWEALAGPMPWSETLSAGPVVVAAHQYGAFGGAVYLLSSAVSRRF